MIDDMIAPCTLRPLGNVKNLYISLHVFQPLWTGDNAPSSAPVSLSLCYREDKSRIQEKTSFENSNIIQIGQSILLMGGFEIIWFVSLFEGIHCVLFSGILQNNQGGYHHDWIYVSKWSALKWTRK